MKKYCDCKNVVIKKTIWKNGETHLVSVCLDCDSRTGVKNTKENRDKAQDFITTKTEMKRARKERIPEIYSHDIGVDMKFWFS